MINHRIARSMRPLKLAVLESRPQRAAASIAFVLLWLATGAHASVACSNSNLAVVLPSSLTATATPSRRFSLASGAKLQKQRVEALAVTQPAVDLSLGQR